jgi:hypothetical protein
LQVPLLVVVARAAVAEQQLQQQRLALVRTVQRAGVQEAPASPVAQRESQRSKLLFGVDWV